MTDDAERLAEIRATSTHRERELLAEIARLTQERDALRTQILDARWMDRDDWRRAYECSVASREALVPQWDKLVQERDEARRSAEGLRAALGQQPPIVITRMLYAARAVLAQYEPHEIVDAEATLRDALAALDATTVPLKE